MNHKHIEAPSILLSHGITEHNEIKGTLAVRFLKTLFTQTSLLVHISFKMLFIAAPTKKKAKIRAKKWSDLDCLSVSQQYIKQPRRVNTAQSGK